ncbi:MAG: hypothetical protein ACRDY7_02345, partial [Acidimicrobiia bacterium]
HSYLVEYLVRRAMLEGKAPGSVQEAFSWAQREIARDYPNRIPVMIDESAGPLVLGTRLRQSAGPPPAATPERTPPPAGQSPSPPEQEPPSPEQERPAPPEKSPEPERRAPRACTGMLGAKVCQKST